jgi:hypothetical protein
LGLRDFSIFCISSQHFVSLFLMERAHVSWESFYEGRTEAFCAAKPRWKGKGGQAVCDATPGWDVREGRLFVMQSRGGDGKGKSGSLQCRTLLESNFSFVVSSRS